MIEQKKDQQKIYNERLLNDLGAGLGTAGFGKIKTLKDFVNYKWIDSLKIKKGEKVLDVGCNAGELLNKIVATYGANAFGLDISDETISVARKYNPFDNDYIVGDAENLPYADKTFDVVVSTDVLEHVPQPDKVISEILRVLRPGGRYYVYCISRRNFLSMRYLMQKLHHPHAWGDFGDHKQDRLIDPGLFRKVDSLPIKKIFYFDSFFMHLVDEFLIRGFLGLVAGRKKSEQSFPEFAKVPSKHPRLSAKFFLYTLMLSAIYYICLVLDTPWRIFKTSDAILVKGVKTLELDG